MKRIEQKVKDLIELRPYSSTYDFAKEPSKALTSYHFTDITSDLMSKWLGKISHVVENNGAAFALAGFRGVGKSHFLSALGAIVGNPDLRSRIGDPHVDATAHALGRRRFNLIWVRRGTQGNLLDELKNAIGTAIGASTAGLSDSLAEMLQSAAAYAPDSPLVLLIDTALERTERVTRDDGAMLGEVAETAKRLGYFVGIALDDDIAGADGANSAITKTFVIDYLDHEHLYNIVDTHIFPKNARTPAVLKEIYDYYRTVVPSFRWSEQRFASLYPLHPSIMEIAPFVRLYLHEFALLGFASDAGARIMGRPANSLIAPDEVFDNVETSLRQIDELAGPFEVFDRLNKDVVAKTPVVKRLQAKLILKGVLLFSLNDEGATAAEIGASMLIFDESDPQAATAEIEAMLAAFAAAAPDGIRVTSDVGDAKRYGFLLNAKDELKSALQSAARTVSDENIDALLQRLASERFPDCGFAADVNGVLARTVDSYLLWRGGVRKGAVQWNFSGGPAPEMPANDWNVLIDPSGSSAAIKGDTSVGWVPAEMSSDDRDALARYWLLLNDTEIRATFSEHVASATQTHGAAAGKLFQRMFLDGAVLSIGGFEYNFTDEARGSATLTQVFTTMLEPLFEGRFPLHPFFPHIVGMKEVSTLASDFFSEARTGVEEIQRLALACCVPLGIAINNGAGIKPATADELRQLPNVQQVLSALAEGGDDSVVTLAGIRARLGAAPYGLVSEAAYLVLTSMVATRLLEFVTTQGDRINHRSLDLKLIWDDIAGVARPVESGYSPERLAFWASAFVGAGTKFSLSKPDDRNEITVRLSDWNNSWDQRSIRAAFDATDETVLTTAVWRAAFSIKPFETVAGSIRDLALSSSSLEEALGNIADAFSDSETEYIRRSGDLAKVENFLAGTTICEQVRSYLAMCEPTGVDEIDGLRDYLWQMAMTVPEVADIEFNRDLANDWSRFQKLYATHFASLHDSLPSEADLKDKLNQIQTTDVWWEFDSLASSPAFDQRSKAAVLDSMASMRRLDCRLEIAELFKATPACGCGFSLALAEQIEDLPRALWQQINETLHFHRVKLRGEIPNIEASAKNGFAASDVEKLVALLKNQKDLRRFTETELAIIKALPTGSATEASAGSGPPIAEVDAVLNTLT